MIPGFVIFLQRIDVNYWDGIYSSLSIDYCFDNKYMGKQLVARKEYCA